MEKVKNSKKKHPKRRIADFEIIQERIFSVSFVPFILKFSNNIVFENSLSRFFFCVNFIIHYLGWRIDSDFKSALNNLCVCVGRIFDWHNPLSWIDLNTINKKCLLKCTFKWNKFPISRCLCVCASLCDSCGWPTSQ